MEHSSPSNPSPLGDATNRPRRVATNLGKVKTTSGKLVENLRRSFSSKVPQPEPTDSKPEAPPTLPDEADPAAGGLSVNSFTTALKKTNFRRPWWDPQMDKFTDLLDAWHQQQRRHETAGTPPCPLFPFGFHKGIWYNLRPGADTLNTAFLPRDSNYIANIKNWLKCTSPADFHRVTRYPTNINNESIFQLEYRTSVYRDGRPNDSELQGFNCLNLGELQWTKGDVHASKEQLHRSKWTDSAVVILVEILEDGTPGPIWARRNEYRGFGVDIDDFETACGLNYGAYEQWQMAKIGNSIDDMGMREWVVFEDVRDFVDDDRWPLYQSKANGRLKFVRYKDERMESDSEGEQEPEPAEGSS